MKRLLTLGAAAAVLMFAAGIVLDGHPWVLLSLAGVGLGAICLVVNYDGPKDKP